MEQQLTHIHTSLILQREAGLLDAGPGIERQSKIPQRPLLQALQSVRIAH
ncbi:hypothetical protein HaloA020_10140 [Halomonas sp. A020]|nr:hypothetical protein HaloA020_10140 [Halomonas sp. A020]